MDKMKHYDLPTGIRLNIDKYLFNNMSASQQQKWMSNQTPQKVETIQGRKPKRKRLSLQERMKRAKEANKASGGSVKPKRKGLSLQEKKKFKDMVSDYKFDEGIYEYPVIRKPKGMTWEEYFKTQEDKYEHPVIRKPKGMTWEEFFKKEYGKKEYLKKASGGSVKGRPAKRSAENS